MGFFGLKRVHSAQAEIAGDRLYLRSAIMDDYETWSRLRIESREFLQPWEPTWPSDDLTRAAYRRRIRRQNDEAARDESYAYLIFDAESHEIIGGLTLGAIRRGVAQSGTLGYWMGKRYAGQGRMTRAVAAAVRHGFGALRLHRIEAACVPGNAPSAALLEKNRFSLEGRAKSYLKIDGAWRDHLLYALIEDDAL